jgi:hypothetical protein
VAGIECTPNRREIGIGLSRLPREHPFFQVLLQESPQPALALANWISRQVPFPSPACRCAAVYTQVVGGFLCGKEPSPADAWSEGMIVVG